MHYFATNKSKGAQMIRLFFLLFYSVLFCRFYAMKVTKGRPKHITRALFGFFHRLLIRRRRCWHYESVCKRNTHQSNIDDCIFDPFRHFFYTFLFLVTSPSGFENNSHWKFRTSVGMPLSIANKNLSKMHFYTFRSRTAHVPCHHSYSEYYIHRRYVIIYLLTGVANGNEQKYFGHGTRFVRFAA